MDTIKRAEELCKERGVAFRNVAERCGLSHSILSNAKARGTQLSVDSIEQICNALDIPLWRFFCTQGCKGTSE